MAISLVRGDLLAADAEALVNPVNCAGVMGKGLAAAFKRAYPAVFETYAGACKAGELSPGKVLTVPTGAVGGPRYIVHFPTKRHWRGSSRIEDLDAGLPALIAEIDRLGLSSVALPALGCGLGGLPWDSVRPRIEAAFEARPGVRVLLFEPQP